MEEPNSFLSCGDALYDMFVADDTGYEKGDSSVHLIGTVGGSPMNVATGLARLGHPSGYFTQLSSDMFGHRIRRFLTENNVDHSLCPLTDLNTTLAIVNTNSDGSANYEFYTDNTADVSISTDNLPVALADNVRVIHLGSYSTAVEPTASSLLRFAQREKTKRLISYDPNLRLMIQPDLERWRQSFSDFASTATIVKSSDEDIESLFGKNKEEHFLTECFDRGAALVFITRGAQGSSANRHCGMQAHCAGMSTNVVDTVGAGDTFQAAILHWLATEGHLSSSGTLEGEIDLEACMKFAIHAAAITCSRKGADLPYLHNIIG